jgi:hypothetical protein
MSHGVFPGGHADPLASAVQTRGGMGALHTYSPEELRAFTQFINEFLMGDPDLASTLLR